MTLHIADIASYQGKLQVGQLKAAGFGGVNFKISHGVTRRSVHPDVAALVYEARYTAGMKLGCFHWLDNSAGGAEQAAYAHEQMRWAGLLVPGVVHTVDVESTEYPPGEQIWRDYCRVMAGLLEHPIVTYTGDWWWTNRARAWQPLAESPWVWSAPNVGYLPDYPGDTSPHWRAGYGGWPELAVMQYRVARVAGVQVSQSAVRSEQLWDQMGGITVAQSQNGWPVVGTAAITDRALFGVEFPNGWLKGDVDVIFTHLIGRLHREVEPMIDPGCWGYYVKPIEGSKTQSNHSSGTAFDYNAPKHPMGTRNTYSSAKRARIRSILAFYEGAVRWGGDYTGRPDDMHFEINKGRAEVARIARKIQESLKPTPPPEVPVGTQFNTDDQNVLKSAATGGVLSYNRGGLPSGDDLATIPASGDGVSANFLNYFRQLCNSVAALTVQVGELRAEVAKLGGTPPPVEPEQAIGTAQVPRA